MFKERSLGKRRGDRGRARVTIEYCGLSNLCVTCHFSDKQIFRVSVLFFRSRFNSPAFFLSVFPHFDWRRQHDNPRVNERKGVSRFKTRGDTFVGRSLPRLADRSPFLSYWILFFASVSSSSSSSSSSSQRFREGECARAKEKRERERWNKRLEYECDACMVYRHMYRFYMLMYAHSYTFLLMWATFAMIKRKPARSRLRGSACRVEVNKVSVDNWLKAISPEQS